MSGRKEAGGFSLAEALVAASIVSVALLVGLALVFWADGIERRAAQRVAAVELASSVAERVRAAPYEAVFSGELDLSPEETAGLPGAIVKLEVEVDEDLATKRVVVEVSWEADPPGRLRLATRVGDAGLYRP